MPVYNNLKYLKKSVDSVLNQTFSDFEFIILDDASEEPVWDFLNEYDDERIILRQNKRNLGLTRSLNICLDMAKGDIIARQDGDDISAESRFEKQLEGFKDHVGLVTTWGENINEEGNIEKKYNRFTHDLIRTPADQIKKLMLSGGRSIVMGPSAMYSREVFEKIGYYDEYFYFSQDYNYWLRVFRHFDLKVVEKILYYMRAHQENSRKKMPERYGPIKGKARLDMIHKRADKFTIIKTKGGFSNV